MITSKFATATHLLTNSLARYKNLLQLALPLFLLVFALPPVVHAQVSIIQAPTFPVFKDQFAHFTFGDLGYDAVNDEVVIVGCMTPSDNVSTGIIFLLNATNDGFTTQALAHLPGGTDNSSAALSISPDASRISGTSSNPNLGSPQGVTWLRTSPNSPVAIGSGFPVAIPWAAWTDGAVGFVGAQVLGAPSRALTWTQASGLQVLPGTGTQDDSARGVSSNGDIVIGSSNGTGHYWNDSGIHRLDDTIPGDTTPSLGSIASSISPDGNYIAGRVFLVGYEQAAVVWEGPNRTLRVLGERVLGEQINVSPLDVSNSGYVVGHAIGPDLNSFGFIWHPSFADGVKIFDDWLQEEFPGTDIPLPTRSVDAIATGKGKLFFTVTQSNLVNAFVEVAMEPLLGDLNQDGIFDFLDIAPFVSILSNGGFQDAADIDGSGVVDFLDIAPFIAMLSAP